MLGGIIQNKLFFFSILHHHVRMEIHIRAAQKKVKGQHGGIPSGYVR